MKLRHLVVVAAVTLPVLAGSASAKAASYVPVTSGTFVSFGGFFSGLCITQSGSGSGSTMNLETCQGRVASQFITVSNSGDGYWKLNGLCFGVPEGNYSAGNVVLETCGTSEGFYESWQYNSGRLEAIPSGSANGYCLDTAGEENGAGKAVTVAPCNSNQSQLFLPNFFTINIVNRATWTAPSPNPPYPGSVYANPNGAQPVPVSLQPWTHDRVSNDNFGEYWDFIENQVFLSAVGDFAPLDVTGGAITNGAGQIYVNLVDNSPTPNSQKWYIEPSKEYTDGSAITIHNLLEFTGLTPSCLNLAGDNPAAGTTIDLAACNASNAQQWMIHLDAAYNAYP
jgi:hypothetical protein